MSEPTPNTPGGAVPKPVRDDDTVSAYLVFEGGGAKGYAYIGAMRCLELDRRVKILGVAGTSAGALTAALVASGFQSADLFDWGKCAGSRGIFEGGLARFFTNEKSRSFLKGLEALQKYNNESWPRKARHLRQIRALRKLMTEVMRDKGLVDLTDFRNWLNETLRSKLGIEEERDVLFSDIPIDLKIVATDATNKAMVIYARPPPGGNDHAVADAVRASLSIPFVFTPASVRDAGNLPSVVVDGGLTSNFPFWLFENDRQREHGHKHPVIGIRLHDESGSLRRIYRAGFLGSLELASDILTATTSGSDVPDKLASRNVHIASLGVAVGTLSFEEADRQMEAITRKAYTDMLECSNASPTLPFRDLFRPR